MTVRSGLLLLPLLLLALPPAAADKPKRDKDFPTLDLTGMTGGEIDNMRQLVDRLPSPCGKPHSLKVSLAKDPACKRSPFALRMVQSLMKNGFLPSEVEERYRERYTDNKCYDIDVAGAPIRGAKDAPVTVIEFSDFQCPVCKRAEPIVKKLLSEFKGMRLIFMNFPLPMHQYAGPAAAAAVAAGKQDRFWAYHDKLFDNQDKLSPVDLLRYAQELRLNVPRFQADMEAARVRVAKERAIGSKLDINGTPTFYINCRRYAGGLTVEEMRSYVEEALAEKRP